MEDLEEIHNDPRPAYIRLLRRGVKSNNRRLHTSPIAEAKVVVLSLGDAHTLGSKITTEIQNEEIPVDQISVTRIDDRTLDQIVNLLEKVDICVTVESHLVTGGLGSLVCEAVATSGLRTRVIRVGVEESIGETVAVCSADLQEPLELIVTLFHTVESGKSDIALGTRRSRNDGWMNNFSSGLFWKIYRRFVMPDMPHGGVDVFACNQTFKFHLLSMKETRTSLIAQIFWLGFKREFIQYDRVKRSVGKSSWSRRKKIDYMLDSIFSFKPKK
jgi:hypothetical protein